MSVASANSVASSPSLGRAAWRIELLGGLRAIPLADPLFNADGGDCAGEPIERFRTHYAALLLARLALFPERAHARDELIDLLWPDAPADRGRANLTQALTQLRAALHQPRTGGLFLTDHKTVRVAKPWLQTDVAEWETAACRALERMPGDGDEYKKQIAFLKATVAAYKGDLLPGFYEDWVESERARLAELRGRLQAHLQILEGAARHSAAVPVSASQATVNATSDTDASAVLNHAPLFLTRFFGRETERVRITDALTQNPPIRLLTLLGMGGIGKTRLAVEALQQVLQGGTCSPFAWAAFVPLDTAQTARQMESVLLAALGVQTAAPDSLAFIAKYLNGRTAQRAGRRLLLVLDNLEQLGGACAPVVARLLTLVPDLTILATSRQPVGIPGERELLLDPLSSSPMTEQSEADVLPEDARLFVDRAGLARPSFALTPDNRRAVLTLCALLEGVPLALELAAAWMRVLTPQQIVARLNRRFDLLALQGNSTAADAGLLSKRHQSLYAAIAWSYDLLGPSLQTVWAQLSVFRGGWTLDAAQAVTGVKDVSEPLLLLTERSLILVEQSETNGAVRYRMLESLREFAHEQLQGQGGDAQDLLRLRHAQYFATLSHDAYEMTRDGRGMRPALNMLGPERDNLRTIFARLSEMKEAFARQNVPVSALFIQAAVESIVQSVWIWPGSDIRSYLELAAEAVEWLPSATASPLHARILALQGRRASLQGDFATGERLLRESLALWEAHGDPYEAVLVRSFIAAQAWKNGAPAQALDIWQECLRFAQQTGNLRLESSMLNNVALVGPDLAARRVWIERAVALDRKHWPGSTFHACSVSCLGYIALEQKDNETARACLEEAHDVAVADGARGMLAVAKACLAEFFQQTDQSLERAEHLLQEAQTLYEELEEWPRIALTYSSRFQVALQRGDADAAVQHARDYLHVSSINNLMDAAGIAEARVDMASRLREAGHDNGARFLTATMA